ncbi:replicative DNA helicase [Oceanidesulfovibrio marinus]|uniref:Replicative DNA helicase n=1 Tax=Oceanidesulfovibrio marinus TaxID=370038 RepID=A0A6M4XFF4_9BACT|nr:replicative DNA helicase [Oceanidesulfovibrio marinus]QJT10552.1 replicative DNA helicase [Oceanidesulfovibrio marinus]TVM34216.1 replicative DNA helicase [Oceanidesulfovibrio marinus]
MSDQSYNAAGPSGRPSKRSDAGTADLLRKVPPHSLEAEQAVLGGIFIKSSVFHSLVDILAEEDFYYPAHQAVYRAFLDLYSKSVPIDLVTVAEYLKGRSELEQVGGAPYLAELAQSVISASNAEYHAKIVRDKAVQRELIEAGTGIVASCFEGGKEVEAILEEAEQSVFKIAERTSGSVFAQSKQLVDNVFKDLQARVERKELVTGVPTGYQKLNEMTAGFQPSDLIIVAARPSMGKTAFALNVAMRAAVMDDTPTAIYSLEMSKEQLMQRMLCAWGKVDLAGLRRGYINDDDWSRLYDAADHLSRAPIFIDDTPSLSTVEIRGRSRRLKMEHNLGLVVVDYLQLMRAGRNIDSREQEISEISRSLKALAKELDLPVIALSQLNRKVEERSDKKPVLSDLRESGAIEQDADVIIFIYRDEVYNKKDDNPKKGTADIIIGKQRNGPTGEVHLAYLGYCTAFEELTDYAPPMELGGVPA